MYLFLFDDKTYYITSAWDFCGALSNCYEFMGGQFFISAELFGKMIKSLSKEEAIHIFNSMFCVKITNVYHKLEPLYQTPKKEETND